MRQFQALVRQFGGDERGVFAVIFALLAIVLVATAGAVVDFTTVEQARARAQDALDSAALGLQRTIDDTGVTEETLMVRAQDLLVERLADANVTATVYDVEVLPDDGTLRLQARIVVPMAFVSLVGINTITAGVVAEVTRGTGANMEVALVLDVTGSMGGTRLATMKKATKDLIEAVVSDDQDPVYSKVALIPFSNAVNVGDYADDVRANIGTTDVTNAAWRETPTTFTISAISKQDPARVTTSSAHGLTGNSIVFLSGITGHSNFTALNNRWFRIGNVTSNTFTLTGINLSGLSGWQNYTQDSGTVTVWASARMASGITAANPAVVTTTSAHGLVDGDAVYIVNAAGGSYGNLNATTGHGLWYTVDVTSTTQFRLLNQGGGNVSTWGYGSYTTRSAIVRKCLTNECEVIAASTGHGLAADDYTYLTNVGYLANVGGNQPVDNDSNIEADGDVATVYQVTDLDVFGTDTFVLENTNGIKMGTYAAGGLSQCLKPGCHYQYFENDAGRDVMWEIDDECVTERIGADQYTDAPPSTTWTSGVYLFPGGGWYGAGRCLGTEMTPLSTNKTDLKAKVEAFVAEGSTAGQIGIAWGWYLLSPEWAYLWPEESQPAEYNTENLLKVVVIMTDGEFNTSYCNHVLAQNSWSSTWDGSDQANCNPNNGEPTSQAAALCDAMTNPDLGMTVYTVGYELTDGSAASIMLEECATSPAHYFDADSAQELENAFAAIGDSISELRLAK